MSVIVRENDNRIDELELEMISSLESINCPLKHLFTKGLYIREIFMPAGTLITSKIHNTSHPFTISKGSAEVSIDGKDWALLEAPYTGITQIGTRRILNIIEDCVWTTYHSLPYITGEENELSDERIESVIEAIEMDILLPYQNPLLTINNKID